MFGTLIVLGVGFVAGLIVGWNFLPQPARVAGWVSEVVLFFREKLGMD
jgi:hypothetical protein